MTPSQPPRLAERLLQAFVPANDFGRGILGDLAEEYGDYSSTHSVFASRFWYTWQALCMSARFGARKLRPRRPALARSGDDHSRPPGPRIVGNIPGDFMFALRLFAKAPLFTLVAGGTLALGIGASTAIFTVVNGVLFRPLPYQEQDRVVQLISHRNGENMFSGTLAYPDLEDYQNSNETFADIVAYVAGAGTVLSLGDPTRLQTARVSGTFFDVLGVQPVIGRFFLPDENELGHAPVAVISYGLWQRGYGGRQDAIGRVIILSGDPFEIVGVTGSDFEDPFGRPEVWVARPPIFDAERQSRYGYWVTAFGRLQDGVTFTQAEDDLERTSARLREEFGGKVGFAVRLERISDVVVGSARAPMLILLGAVGLVLLIACANIANLFLSRASRRQKEFALRAALGAERGRLVQQLLTESFVLSLLGVTVGLVLARLGTDALVSFGGDSIPRVDAISLDAMVAAFAAGATVLATLVFGLVPALSVTRGSLNSFVAESGRSTGSVRTQGLRSVFIVSQVALSVMLLIGASLLVRSFAKLIRVDAGVAVENVVTVRLNPNDDFYPEAEQMTALWEELERRFAAIPGVSAVGGSIQIPMGTGMTPNFSYTRDDQPPPEPGAYKVAQARTATPGFFRAIGLRVVRGRVPNEDDVRGTTQVVAINEALAREAFPNEDPIGMSITLQQTSQEIVGIVADVKSLALDQDPVPMVYTNQAQEPAAWMRESMIYAFRTPRTVTDLVADVRRTVQELDRTIPITDVRSMEQVIRDNVAGPRFRTILVSAFAVAAILLAAIGIVGVMSFNISQRTNEIGIRMALGATRFDVTRLVVGQGMRLAALGLGIGVIGAALATRAMAGLLYQVRPLDLVTFAAVPVGLGMVAFLSSYVPARAAAVIDPTEALRHD